SPQRTLRARERSRGTPSGGPKIGARRPIPLPAGRSDPTAAIDRGRCGPDLDYAGGPLAKVTVSEWAVPDVSDHPTVTTSPGWWGTSISVSAEPSASDLPPKEVIVSPATTPADAAAEPGTTLRTI